MGDITMKLNKWINESLYPALIAYKNFTNSVSISDGFSLNENTHAMLTEDFNKTYEILLNAIIEIKMVFKDALFIEKDAQIPEDLTRYKFEENCKAYKLTGREIEIIKLMAKGKSAKAIAELLFVSHKTVQTHLSNAYKKVNVKNRFNLIAKLGIPIQQS